jgi:hypothetical protein
MSGEFETNFITATDKPALIAFSTPEWLETAKAVLIELGYKVHTAATHSDFAARFSQVHYQVIVIEELFGANTIEENITLQSLQHADGSVQIQRPRRHQQFGNVLAQATRRKSRR